MAEKLTLFVYLILQVGLYHITVFNNSTQPAIERKLIFITISDALFCFIGYMDGHRVEEREIKVKINKLCLHN